MAAWIIIINGFDWDKAYKPLDLELKSFRPKQIAKTAVIC